MTPRLAVIGAGPMGLEAALLGLERGMDPTVLEKEDVGHGPRQWGRARFFTPFEMNASQRLVAVLSSAAPRRDELLTGREMAEVLKVASGRPPLMGRIRTQTRVVAVGRSRLTRTEMPGHPMRGERPFRLLLETPRGEETLEAEVVIDASGVLDSPACLGAGGLPALGERQLHRPLVRTLGALEKALPELRGKRVLVVGHGHSAATAVGWLADLSEPPQVTWAVRSPNRRPCVEIADDPLKERARVVSRANDLASGGEGAPVVLRRTLVEAIDETEAGLSVRFSPQSTPSAAFDAVLSFTGYRPDLSFLRELALEVAPVTEGAARLSSALARISDCLTPPSVRPTDLESGERGFYLAGAKSYGRLPTFLLKTGLSHLETILTSLSEAK